MLDAAVVGPTRLAVLRATDAGSEVQVLELPSLTQVAAIPVPTADASALHYDPESNLLAYVAESSTSGSTVYLFAPEDRASLTSIPSVFSYNQISVAGSTLWGPGRYRRID